MNDLKQADEILADYIRKDSTVDVGNLFFAATEYKNAYKIAHARLMAEGVAMSCLTSVDRHGLREVLNELDSLKSERDKLAGENERLNAKLSEYSIFARYECRNCETGRFNVYHKGCLCADCKQALGKGGLSE